MCCFVSPEYFVSSHNRGTAYRTTMLKIEQSQLPGSIESITFYWIKNRCLHKSFYCVCVRVEHLLAFKLRLNKNFAVLLGKIIRSSCFIYTTLLSINPPKAGNQQLWNQQNNFILVVGDLYQQCQQSLPKVCLFYTYTVYKNIYILCL